MVVDVQILIIKNIFIQMNISDVPSDKDLCAWMLLKRAFNEIKTCDNPCLIDSKIWAFIILIKYGWKDVFKENIIENKTTNTFKFKSEDERARFHFCDEIFKF